MMDFNPVTYAIPVFVLLIVAELVWARRTNPAAYESRDTAVSLAIGLGSTVAGALSGGLVVAMLVWLHGFAVLEIGWAWWAWPFC